MSKVALVSTYELGLQPIGVAATAANLIDSGIQVEILDVPVEGLREEILAKADFVGISIPMHTALKLGLDVAKKVKQINPTAHVCFFGLYASLSGRHLLEEVADSVVGGEYSYPLINLIKKLNGDEVVNLEGVWTKNKYSPPYLGRPTYTTPARYLLPPLEKYAKLLTSNGTRLIGNVETTRGCAHTCLHCPITPVYSGKLRVVPESVVMEDIRNLVRMGAEHITFVDPDFLNGVKHTLNIVRKMHEEFPTLTYDFTTKVEHIVEYAHIFPELKSLGCLFVLSAFESSKDEVLKNFEKGHTRKDMELALKIVRDVGIDIRPTLVFFNPWVTVEDLLDCLEFIEDNELIYNIEPVQYAIRLLVPKGSSLAGTDQLPMEVLREDGFNLKWTHSDERIDRIYDECCHIVENAAHNHEDQLTTFLKVKDLMLIYKGKNKETRGFNPAVLKTYTKKDLPRISECWFCCAEPTSDQVLQSNVLLS
jgi:radical SAM superfamily enzyme YgiQ (UPF0313 family)